MVYLKNIYGLLQLGCYSNSPDVLEMFFIACKLWANHSQSIKVSRIAAGKKYRTKYNNLDRFLNSIKLFKQKKSNEINVEFQFYLNLKISDKLTLKSINMKFMISPLNKCWADVYGFEMQNRSEENYRMSFESRERNIRWKELNKYPSIFITKLNFISKLAIRDTVELCAEKLMKELNSTDLDWLDFGYMDFFEDKQSIGPVNLIMSRGNSLTELDKKINQTHDIMLLNAELGNGIQSVLPGNAITLIRINSLKGIDFVLLTVSDHEHIHRDQIGNFIAYDISDDRLFRDDPNLGQFIIEGCTFFNYRRYLYLKRNKMLPTISKGKGFFPLIIEKYARLLGIKKGDLLVRSGSKIFYEKKCKEIDRNYEMLSSIDNEKKRVWEAHRILYEDNIYYRISKKLLGKLKELYFNDIDD